MCASYIQGWCVQAIFRGGMTLRCIKVGNDAKTMGHEIDSQNGFVQRYGMQRDKVLASGSFGTVWSLQALPTCTLSKNEWILKVTYFDEKSSKKRLIEEGFDREVYFLKLFSPSRLTPQLLDAMKSPASTSTTIRFGLQLIERFDSSLMQLGQDQAQQLLSHRSDLKKKIDDSSVCFTMEQLDRVVALILGFSRRFPGVTHGDLKRANILQSNNGQRMVLADFGFAGGRGSPFHPLLGFVTHHGCSTTTNSAPHNPMALKLQRSVPPALLPYLNQWEIYRDFLFGRRTRIYNPLTWRLKRRWKHKFTKALQLTRKIRHQFEAFCTKNNNNN